MRTHELVIKNQHPLDMHWLQRDRPDIKIPKNDTLVTRRVIRVGDVLWFRGEDGQRAQHRIVAIDDADTYHISLVPSVNDFTPDCYLPPE